MTGAIPFPDISPELFSLEILGLEFSLRWYALAYIVGVIVAWRLGVVAVNRPALWSGKPPMRETEIDGMISWTILGIVLGGRLGYVLFYQPGHYLANPQEILMVWKGGMSFHGGFLGVVLAVYVYCLRLGAPILQTADLVAQAVAPGLLFGRLSNFVNAELWGRPSDAPWAVVFPGAAAQDCPGVVGPCARHPSQLYEAALEGLVLGSLLLWMVHRRKALHRPGLVTGTFFAGYGTARFLVEFFRQPDAQFVGPGNPLGLAFHVGGIGLTMGQILSLPMIALGLWLVRRAARAESPA